jgi:MoaA/NifB/PqqE/SkfB family radical SAM enzyme
LFTGGEPTIREDIVFLTELVSKMGGRVELLSNARRFSNLRFAQRMAKAGLEKVHASFYGHTSKLTQELTRRKNSFRETISGIRNLMSSGIDAEVRTLVTFQTFTLLPTITRTMYSTFPDAYGYGIYALDTVGNALNE